MNRALFGWWTFATAVVSGLTTPRSDIAALDREAADVVRASRLYGRADAAYEALARAWFDSRARVYARAFATAWPHASPADAIRSAAWCTVAAAGTVLLLQTIESAEDGPYRWVLPLAVAVTAALVARGADALARAWEERRRRR
jgi:hypothetical protein